MKKCSFLLLALLPFSLNAQITISGQVIGKTRQMPLAYVNIGVPGKDIGTVSDEHGNFELVLPEDLREPVVMVQHAGYEDHPLDVKLTSKKPQVFKVEMGSVMMNQKDIDINGKETSLGFKTQTTEANLKFIGKGAETGTLVKNKDTLAINSFGMKIIKNTFPASKFRVNFYTVKGSKLGPRLNFTDYILDLSAGFSGDVAFPLQTPVKIFGDFVCTIELIALEEEVKSGATLILAGMKDSNSNRFSRKISMGKLETGKDAIPCFWFTGNLK